MIKTSSSRALGSNYIDLRHKSNVYTPYHHYASEYIKNILKLTKMVYVVSVISVQTQKKVWRKSRLLSFQEREYEMVYYLRILTDHVDCHSGAQRGRQICIDSLTTDFLPLVRTLQVVEDQSVLDFASLFVYILHHVVDQILASPPWQARQGVPSIGFTHKCQTVLLFDRFGNVEQWLPVLTEDLWGVWRYWKR